MGTAKYPKNSLFWIETSPPTYTDSPSRVGQLNAHWGSPKIHIVDMDDIPWRDFDAPGRDRVREFCGNYQEEHDEHDYEKRYTGAPRKCEGHTWPENQCNVVEPHVGHRNGDSKSWSPTKCLGVSDVST